MSYGRQCKRHHHAVVDNADRGEELRAGITVGHPTDLLGVNGEGFVQPDDVLAEPARSIGPAPFSTTSIS